MYVESSLCRVNARGSVATSMNCKEYVDGSVLLVARINARAKNARGDAITCCGVAEA